MQFVPAEFNPENVHVTILKSNLGYDQYTEVVEDNFFLIALANVHQWPLVPFFQISLKNSEHKTTLNTFWDCHLPFFPATFLEITIYDSVTFDDVFNCHTLMTECVIIGMAMNKTKTF